MKNEGGQLLGFLVFTLTLGVVTLSAQMINGSQNPSAIPDSVAWRMVFVTMSTPSDYLTAKQAQTGLSPVPVPRNTGASDLSIFQSQMQTFYTQYQSAITSSTDPDIQDTNRDSVVSNTETALQSQLSSDGWTQLQSFIQAEKVRMMMTAPGTTYSDPNAPVNFLSPNYATYENVSPDPFDNMTDTLTVDGNAHCGGGYCSCSVWPAEYTTFNGGNVWTQIGGTLSTISMASDGTVIGTNSSHQVWQFSGLNQNWIQLPSGPGNLVQVSAGSSSNVWGVNSNGNVWSFNPATQLWSQMPGILTQISVSKDGSVYGVNSGHSVFKWNGSAWVALPGGLYEIAAFNYNTAYGIGLDHNVYVWNGVYWTRTTSTGNFIEVASPSAGVGGDVYTLDTSGNVYKNYAKITGNLGAGHLAVGSTNDIFGVASWGAIYRYYPTEASSHFGFQVTPPTTYINYSAEGFLHDLPPGTVFSATDRQEVQTSCIPVIMDTGSFPLSFRIATTYYGPPPTVVGDECWYTTLACSTGTPTCKGSSPGIIFVPGCPSYLKGSYLVVNGTCEFSVGTAATGPGPCD